MEQLEDFISHAKAATPDIRRETVEAVAKLRAARNARLAQHDVSSSGTPDLIGNHIYPQIPAGHCGRYFGYRRSATKGHIVRFHINIENDRRSKGRFSGTFIRGNEQTISGQGWFAKDHTNLIGHAFSTGTPPSYLGCRFLTLHELPDMQCRGKSRCLSGLLVTYDETWVPFAARIVLVPEADHQFTVQKPIRGNSDIWLKDRLKEPITFGGNIKKEIGKVFGTAGPERFLELIRNTTISVLKSNPPGTAGVSFSVQEEKLREVCDDAFSLDVVFDKNYESFLKILNEEISNPYVKSMISR